MRPTPSPLFMKKTTFWFPCLAWSGTEPMSERAQSKVLSKTSRHRKSKGRVSEDDEWSHKNHDAALFLDTAANEKTRRPDRTKKESSVCQARLD